MNHETKVVVKTKTTIDQEMSPDHGW